jgi:iron-sulfur cluster assembly accessory protein
METTTHTHAPAPVPSEQALKLTAKAVEQVKAVIQAQGFEGYFLSIRVVPAGCSGLGYDLNLVKEAKAGDVTWEQDGVKIATDALSTKYLGGTEVDYVVGDTGAGFKFNNPNARSSCGCGSSFST